MTHNPPDEWIHSNAPAHEAIISPALFDAARTVRTQRARNQGRQERAGKRGALPYALRGRIRCSLCGRKMQPATIRSHVYYRCEFKEEEAALYPDLTHPRTVYHVRAGHDGGSVAVGQYADHSRAADAAGDLVTEIPQSIGHLLGRAVLPQAEFRMLVKITVEILEFGAETSGGGAAPARRHGWVQAGCPRLHRRNPAGRVHRAHPEVRAVLRPRYCAEGRSGLQDRSSSPHRHATRYRRVGLTAQSLRY